MRRRSRLLRVAKWGGVAMCAVIASGYALGGYDFAWIQPNGAREFAIRSGWVRYNYMDPTLAGHRYPSERGFSVRQWTTLWNRKFTWWPPIHIGFGGNKQFFGIRMPLWSLLLGTAVPTALLWRFDRRPLPGHCPCGYDLTGNVSGTCPECGAPFDAKSEQ